MLYKGVIAESELSHIQVDQASGLYRPEFHLTLLRAGNRPIDATKIFKRFGDFSFGTVQATTIHISSREDFEDGSSRM